MPMYNLIEYSDNYSDPSHKGPIDIFGVFINITEENSSSFKYKSNLICNTVADGANRQKKCKSSCTTKIFKQFLEIFRNATNCKVEFSLK